MNVTYGERELRKKDILVDCFLLAILLLSFKYLLYIYIVVNIAQFLSSKGA